MSNSHVSSGVLGSRVQYPGETLNQNRLMRLGHVLFISTERLPSYVLFCEVDNRWRLGRDGRRNGKRA